ncbi:AMP-binding protein, partial [Streptomyces sp. NPDC057757]
MRLPGRGTSHPFFVDAVLAHARRDPDRTAVESDGGRLTRRELAVRSGELAAVLRGAGVVPGDRVAMIVGRGVEIAVALLATLRVGAVYVPVDVSWPDNRIRTILADARAAAVVCDGDNGRRDCFPSGQLLLGVGDHEADRGTDLTAADSTATDFTPDGSHPAYMIYTSGSTGRPKGVVVPHGALAARLGAFEHVFRLSGRDRFLAQSSVAFDASILDLFLPLALGCRTFIASDAQRRDPDEVRALLESRSLNATFATPTQWRSLVL